MQLPSLMTPQQKDEQFQAIRSKLEVKSSLTELCEKHITSNVVFERASDSTKFCEKCFTEITVAPAKEESDEEEEDKNEGVSSQLQAKIN